MEQLKLADLIFVRESRSHNYLKTFNIESTVTPDMTFITPVIPIETTRKYVAFTDSVSQATSIALYKKYTSTKNSIFIPPLKYADFNHSKYFYFKDRMKLLYFKLLKKLAVNMDYKEERYLFYIDDFNEYLEQLFSSSLLITGRFHSLCFALLTRTPFVALKSNTFKIEGLLEDIGLHNRVYDTIEEIDFNHDFQFTHEELKKVSDFLDASKIKILHMFEQIAHL